jgi:hypothetical protein
MPPGSPSRNPYTHLNVDGVLVPSSGEGESDGDGDGDDVIDLCAPETKKKNNTTNNKRSTQNGDPMVVPDGLDVTWNTRKEATQALEDWALKNNKQVGQERFLSDKERLVYYCKNRLSNKGRVVSIPLCHSPACHARRG